MKSVYICEISNSNRQLSTIELDLDPILSKDGFVITKNFKKRGYAFTKKAYKVVSSGKTESSVIKNLKKFKGAVSINYSHFRKSKFTKKILEKLSSKVNLSNPNKRIVVFYFDKYYITELVWENKDRFEDRRMQFLPAPHPTGMHPRLARCLVNIASNLTSSKKLLDPFCGAGGLLIEAGLSNYKIEGWDINNIQLKRAKLNLKEFKLDSKLLNKSALDLSRRINLVITDLPYGKNSQIKDKELYDRFFDIASKKVKYLIVGLPDKTLSRKKLDSFVVLQEFRVPLHKALDKKIYVLKNRFL